MKNIIYIIFIFLLSSCIKDKPQEPKSTLANVNLNNTVLIVNEGNYGWGVGTISLYDTESGTVVEKYDQQQNNGTTLGNVCQSIYKYNNKYYIVINNSNKIVVADGTDFTKKTTISGFNSPRYFLPITYNKAYVSDLYSSSIQVVDLNTNSISGSIPCHSGTEQMELIYNKAFITCSTSNYLYVVNTTTDQITDSIQVGNGASSITIDKFAKIWVLASGNTVNSQTGKLHRINPITLQIEQSFVFNNGESPFRLCSNKTHDTLYYLNNGVFQFPINSSNLPTTALINQGTKIFYGLGVNPKNYSIYVSDVIDYVQRSKIEIYSPNGSFITNFNAGIISNSFMFE